MDLKIIYGIAIIGALYVVYKAMTKPNKELQNEFERIIKSDEYKVKSQYDKL